MIRCDQPGGVLPRLHRKPMSMAGTMAVRTLVLIEQFEIRDNSITHKPTGWRFTAYQDSPTDGTVIRGRLGNKLEAEEDFRPHEVEEMARRLWTRHLEARKKQL